MQKPTVSIIIRTFNEEKHLGNLLTAIKRQSHKAWEVIVVDSGSKDRTLEIAAEHNAKILTIESRDFTFGYSLNVGCKAAVGEYLVIASAHVLPTSNQWLTQLIEPFTNPQVAMVYGRQQGDLGAKFSEQRDLARLFGASRDNRSVLKHYANNANAAVRKSLWDKKPFDEYLFGLEDLEWAREMASLGYTVEYAPEASVYHIHREMWAQVFNRYRREAIAAYRIGLPNPPQARLEYWWLALRLVDDLLATFPNYTPRRVHEILRFRYYQWKGSRQGWYNDRHLDLDRDKFELFHPSTNRAVVIHDKTQAAVTELPVPDLKPGDVLLEVSHVGVCHTDLEVHDGTLGYYAQGVAQYPIVPGHEYSGTIVKLGASTKLRERFSVGQRVVGECILSRDEQDRKEVGVINHHGAYAQLVAIPGTAMHVVPEGMSMETAVLTEPLAVVLRGLRRVLGRITSGASVAVMGAGPIGNLAGQVLMREGYQVVVFDKNADRLALLPDSIEGRSQLAGLNTFDLVVEATGAKAVLEHILRETRTDATLLLLGFPYGDISYNFEDIVGHEKVIAGSVGAESEDFKRALELLPLLNTEPFTKTIVPLEQFKKAWDIHTRGKHLKVILKP